MRLKAVRKLIQQIEAADTEASEQDVEPLLKQLLFGVAENLAAIADALAENPKA